ncbi:hypothetical protein HN51_029717 [Arachis hypogaea]
MYMPFHASLLLLSLVLVVGCLTATSSASSLYANARKNLIESNSTAIKASDNDVLLTFINEVYDKNIAVFMFFNLEDKRTLLVSGVLVQRYSDSQRQTGLIYFDVLCVIFYQYDPAVDGGHDAVHWSVREDGLYKSYDKEKWVLTKTWRNDNCG